MSESLIVDIPWGKASVSALIGDEPKIQMALLQQSIIDQYQVDLAQAEARLQIAQERCYKLEMEFVTASGRAEQLAGELDEARQALEQQGDISASELKELNDKVLRLEAEVELAEQTRQQAIQRNYDQERKLEALQYQKDTVQRLFDEQRHGLARLKKEHSELSGEHELLSTEMKDARKYIHQLEQELAGVPSRIENAVATALANHREGDGQEVARLNTAINEKQQEIERLTAEVDQLVADKTEVENELNTRTIQCNDALQLAQLAQENVHAMEGQYNLMKDRLVKYEGMAKQAAEMVAFTQEQLVQARRSSVYLTQLVKYLEGGSIYSHEDGTVVFGYHRDMSDATRSTGDGSPDLTPHDDYPLYWVVNPDGVGHMVMLAASEDALLFPEQVDDSVLVGQEHKDGIVEAIKSRPKLSEQQNAMHEEMARAQGIMYSAELLDFNFADTYDRIKFIKALIAGGQSQQEIDEMDKGFDQVIRLSQRYRSRQKQKDLQERKSQKPSRSTGRKKPKKRKR